MAVPKKIIIGLTGKIACGKGITKKYIMSKYGDRAADYRFSTILRDVLNRLDVETGRENLQKISLALRTTFGDDLLAKAIAKDIVNDKHDIVIIDGIRRLNDIKYLRKIHGFILIRIVAEEKLRFLRVVFRNENKGDNEKTFDDFLNDEKAEAEMEIPRVMAKAEMEIYNEDTIIELERNIDKVINKIKTDYNYPL
ncbi:MAG: hypothetical protein WCK37_04505 [Candidatus Falkowbacteria bacterium]